MLRAAPRFLDFGRARPATRGGEGDVRTARRAVLRVRGRTFRSRAAQRWSTRSDPR